MQSYLLENEKILSLDEARYANPNILCEELSVKSGRQSKSTDGCIYIFLEYFEDECLAVVEIKKGVLHKEHLDQLKDYLDQNKEIKNTIFQESN